MSDKKNADGKLLPHNYDGIQELDNPLPGWWLATFYITIVFSVGYYGYYEVFNGPSSDQELAEELAEVQKSKLLAEEQVDQLPKLSLEELNGNAEMMATAKGHYDSKCAACHGQNGEGLIGPNLADNFWIYSKGGLDGIIQSIREGYLDKGMPPWKDLIPNEEQPYLAAYVKNMQGTNPANPKPPQGEKIIPD